MKIIVIWCVASNLPAHSSSMGTVMCSNVPDCGLNEGLEIFITAFWCNRVIFTVSILMWNSYVKLGRKITINVITTLMFPP